MNERQTEAVRLKEKEQALITELKPQNPKSIQKYKCDDRLRQSDKKHVTKIFSQWPLFRLGPEGGSL